MKHFCSFSEAIREGAKLRPQSFGAGMDDARSKTCAWVAGVEAMCGVLDGPEFTRCNPNETYLYLHRNRATCPASPCSIETPISLMRVIFHLNDIHEWSREEIADWLESEEEKLGYVTLTIEEDGTCAPSTRFDTAMSIAR